MREAPAASRAVLKCSLPPTTVPRFMLDLGPSEDFGVVVFEGTNSMG
jgi:hypothetical protein